MQANVRFVAGDLEGFRKSGERATSLNPNDNAILAHFALRLALSGSWQEGLAIMDKAIALNPVHPHWYHFPWVFYHYEQQEFRQALAKLDRIKMPDFFWTHLWRTVLNAELNNHASAQEALEKLIAQRPDLETEIQNILSVWLLDEAFKKRLMLSLEKAGLGDMHVFKAKTL
jgi:tetratricopeptide (TPR) repeat protein